MSRFSACSMLSFGRAQPFSSPIRKGRVASSHQGRRQSSAFVSTIASLALTGATVPCTLHLRCARSRIYIYIYEFVVQAPVGFCGLAAFTADGNSVSIARRGRSELKHGRVSMLATVGYIAMAALMAFWRQCRSMGHYHLLNCHQCF